MFKNISKKYLALLAVFIVGTVAIALILNRNNAIGINSNSLNPVSSHADENFDTFVVSAKSKLSNISFVEPSATELRGLNYSYGNLYGNLSLVNAATYMNDVEVYERTYMSKTQSGAFIKSGNLNYNGKVYNTALMRAGTGGYTYRLITGIKKGTHGYYMSIEIPNLPQELSDSDKTKALNFDLYPEHKSIFGMFVSFTEEDFSEKLFNTPTINQDAVNKYKSASIDFGGGEFPTTF